MAGLVFQEIREARGLAYSAFASLFENGRRRDDALVFAFLGTQVDKTNDALNALLTLFDTFKVDSARFTSAKSALEKKIQAARADPRLIGRRVFDWADFDLTEDPGPARHKALKEVKEPDLQAFAEELLGNQPVVAIAGDRTRIDMRALKKRFFIVELRPKDLVSY